MIKRAERLSYAAGDAGFNLIWQSIELYLFFFYVEVLGLSLAFASAVFLIGAAVDWLSDPVIGVVADRASARLPMRMWVLIGGPAAGVALVLAFVDPGLSGGALALWVAATHIALRFAYSLGNIPYAALTARMTHDRAEQVALTGTRMQGAALGGITAAICYALVPTAEGSGERQFWYAAIALGVLAQPLLLVTALGVRERFTPPSEVSGISPIVQLSAFFRLLAESAPLRRLIATLVAAGLATTMLTKSLLFLYNELGHPELGYRAALIPSLALLLSVPLWVALGQRWGRVQTLVAALLLHLAAMTVAGVAMPGVITTSTAYCVAIIASCGTSVMFWSLVPPVVADLEARRGSSCAARVYALSTTARKLGQALSPLIIAASLSIVPGKSVMPGLWATAALAALVVLLYRPVAGRKLNAD